MKDETRKQATDRTGQWAISRAQNARQVAHRLLAERYPKDFAELLAQERVKRNLPAVAKKAQSHKKEIVPVGGTPARSVTVTFRYGKSLRTLVARRREWALAEAEQRWGAWDAIECFSTPNTIYNDLLGQSHMNLSHNQDEAMRE